MQLLWRCGGAWRRGRRAGSVIKSPEMRAGSCGMCTVLVGDVTCCVMTICVLVSQPPGYRRRELCRVVGERTGAQVMKRGSGEHGGVTGFNNVIKSVPLPTRLHYLADRQSRWPAGDLLLHLGILLQPVICRQCQLRAPMAPGHRPASTLTYR